jgi:heterotetrameric sarcosine oxidase gamma subunit
MPEWPATYAEREEPFRLRPASARSVLRVKSWLPHSPTMPLILGGCVLPHSVGAVTEGSPRVLTTGPADWLLSHSPTRVERLRNVWAPELTTKNLALVDLTDGLAVLEASGSRVREILSKSCGLDFAPRYFGAGHCARTRFANIPVVIDCLEDSGIFCLYVPRSYRHYLQTWLVDAASIRS